MGKKIIVSFDTGFTIITQLKFNDKICNMSNVNRKVFTLDEFTISTIAQYSRYHR